MELMQEVKDYSQEELEEDEEEIMTKTTREEEESSSKQQLQHCTFSSPPSNFSLSSSSPSTTHHHNHNHNHDVTNVSHQQNQWLGMNHHHHHSPESHNSAASKGGLGLLHQHQHQDATTSNFTNLKQIDFMELSLGNNNNNKNKDVVINDPVPQEQEQQPSTHEKEHMFDKVVTPSDVGKLNRLVIPKQHAEKYFPLDSTSNEKGLLLNFEDRNGKLWRFRYSYWNSSQSYVMTKGWSRFVKEKKLDAGDIVSFQRGVGELFRHRLFIDWKRRSNHNHHTIDPSSATLFTPFFLPNQQQYSIRWGGANSRFYSLPYPTPQRLQHQQQNHHDPLHNQMNFNHNMFPFHQYGGGNVNHQYNFHHHDPSSVFYMRSLAPSSMSMPQGSLSTRSQQQEGGGGSNVSNMIIDSVPVSHYHHHHGNLTSNATTSTTTNGAAKRLRLFGVNMECGGSSTSDDNLASPSSIVPSLQHLKVPHHEETLSSSTSTRFEEDKRREEASMIFGLDTSLQYHNYQQQ